MQVVIFLLFDLSFLASYMEEYHCIIDRKVNMGQLGST